jgi:quercetin dioxygenase-like cupin family protein
MNLSRRDLSFLLPVLAAARAAAQEKQEKLPLLPSKTYHNDAIPYTGDERKKTREFFHGTTHVAFALEMHETVLGPGMITHPPHRHEHEEIIIVFEGTVETTVDGKTDRAETGSVIYFGSNTLHNARNAGNTTCRYYVIELRGV